MSNRIRILAIAPYEGMKQLMVSIAADYPQIDLTAFVGDREQGLQIAKNNFHGNYDAVISRGGTASLMRQDLRIPVVEIELSMYDILCALKLTDGMDGRIAMISTDNIASSARMLCKLMQYDMDIFTYSATDHVETVLQRIRAGNYRAVLCDMRADTAAKRMGFTSFLLTSSPESIRKAFEQVLLLCDSQKNLRDENQFFRELIHGQIGQSIVFDEDGNLFLSTQEDPKPELLAMLRKELPESQAEPERRITRNLGGMLYAIRARRITSGSLTYIAFFFDARKTPLSPSQVGIRFSTRPEAEDAFYNSIFNFAGSIHDYQQDIERINQSAAPVMVTGEDGTGKESIVKYLYLRGSLRNNPLVSIQCGLLNDKSWAFLLEHHNSPLSDQGNTLYFASIDALSQERCQQLLAVLSEMDVCRRNRVIFSCVCQPEEYTSEVGSLFMDKLCCLSLYLPPLRKLAERIPALVNLSLSHMNVDLPRQVMGAEPEAIALLQRFQWPHNYTQFRRVLGELAVTASGQFITAENVRQALRKERHVGAFTPHVENAAAPLNLNRTLDEISRDVALRVVEETGGNQTAAAKRLGISRTTLWRLLQPKT